MFKVGITGGIGSGKSMVTKIFEVLHIPTLDADKFARELMQERPEVRAQLVNTFGACIFNDGGLDRERLSAMVFNNRALLEKLNNIVHPAVKRYGTEWMEAQDAPYVVKEAALFFETGSHADMDVMVGVAAPEAIRLERAMQRDNADETAIRKRMAAQMDEAEKMQRCDHVIDNDGTRSLIEQVLHLHRRFLNNDK